MKIAIVFPGYGSQFVGMGKELYDEHRVIQEYFEEASNCLDKNFIKLCFASSDAELSRPINAYTATFLVSCALAALLKQEGIQADAVAGYNLGEYAALCSMGGITFPDGLYLLNKYATLYTEALESMQVHAISVEGLTSDALENICFKASSQNGHAFIAVYESPKMHIVAGTSESIERVKDMVTEVAQKTDVNYVDTAIGLHSPLMEPVIQQFQMYLEKVDFKDLLVPLIGVNGRAIQEGAQVREQELKRMSSPVMWTETMKMLGAYDLIIEVGPGTHLATLLKNAHPDKTIVSLNKPQDLVDIKSIVFPPEVKIEENNSDSNKEDA